jgi:carboxyl-terminal processing protease
MPQKFQIYIKHTKTIILVILLAITLSGFYRNLSASDDETYKGLKLFSDTLELIEKNYVDEVDAKDLIHKAIQGMVSGLDPHSSLLLPEDLQDLQMDTQGEFTGIGISITMKDGLVTVISPIEGTPAYHAGIIAGDKIIEVNGTPTKDLKEAVSLIRGPKGTKVTVTIIRETEKEPLHYELVRDIIPIESVRFFTLKPGYGYVWVTNFRENTLDELVNALDKLEKGNVPLKGLVLDLRDNPGGLLNQSIEVSDLFLQSGKILSIKGRKEQNVKTYMAHPDHPARTYPIVVLINGGSASASEIVAGALQDQKRALIMGTTSFGKGSVQNVETLRDGYGLKLTIARYYTPSGRSIQAQGIEPDIVVKDRFVPKQPVEEEKPERIMIKEKDLKNHLEAEPSKEDANKKPAKKTDETQSEQMNETEFRQGPLTADKIKSDNQVMRALEILTGYELLRGMNN